MMNYLWHDSAQSFLDALQAGARQDMVRYSLTVGCALWALERAEDSKPLPLLLTIEDGNGFQGAAFMSPPRKLLLQCPSHMAADVAREIHAHGWAVPMVHVNADAAGAFTAAWAALTGHTMTPFMVERMLALRQVLPPACSPGTLRKAGPDDADLLTAWLMEFQREALPEEPITEETARNQMAASIDAGTRYVWENAEPVSMALVLRRVLDGVWITGVHTPPEHRRHGYASACVAQLSAQCLAEGAAYCFLFTDLANPTSNAIYEKIGYEPMCDFHNYSLNAP
jgi:predicted GNAT family acetyltransferase